MKKINIYMFHFGPSRIPDFVNEIRKIKDVNLILGPTTEEHEKLLKIKYYKNAFDKNIYAFMSDYWRMWKIMNNEPGLYLDTSYRMEDASKFEALIKSLGNFNLFIKEKPNKIATCFYYLSDSSIAKRYLNRYDKFKSNIRKFPISPAILTDILEGDFIMDSYEIEKTTNSLFVPATKILKNGEYGIQKIGTASWNKWAPKWWKRKTASNYWNNIFKNWNHHTF